MGKRVKYPYCRVLLSHFRVGWHLFSFPVSSTIQLANSFYRIIIITIINNADLYLVSLLCVFLYRSADELFPHGDVYPPASASTERGMYNVPHAAADRLLYGFDTSCSFLCYVRRHV